MLSLRRSNLPLADYPILGPIFLASLLTLLAAPVLAIVLVVVSLLREPRTGASWATFGAAILVVVLQLLWLSLLAALY
jgi:hypothetical protein